MRFFLFTLFSFALSAQAELVTKKCFEKGICLEVGKSYSELAYYSYNNPFAVFEARRPNSYITYKVVEIDDESQMITFVPLVATGSSNELHQVSFGWDENDRGTISFDYFKQRNEKARVEPFFEVIVSKDCAIIPGENLQNNTICRGMEATTWNTTTNPNWFHDTRWIEEVLYEHGYFMGKLDFIEIGDTESKKIISLGVLAYHNHDSISGDHSLMWLFASINMFGKRVECYEDFCEKTEVDFEYYRKPPVHNQPLKKVFSNGVAHVDYVSWENGNPLFMAKNILWLGPDKLRFFRPKVSKSK